MAIYRRANRNLVAEQALVIPLAYGFRLGAFLKQPWVIEMGCKSLGIAGARFITVDPKKKPPS